MKAGISWEGSVWKPTREVSSTEVRQRRTVKAILLSLVLSLVLLAIVIVGMTLASASPAQAAVCSITSFNPYKVSGNELRGRGRLNCRPQGISRTFSVGVWRNINNFPDPRVCRRSKTTNYYPSYRACKGRFGNRGYFYTYSNGGGGSDYSQFIYFRPR